jgi:hypothetical protein
MVRTSSEVVGEGYAAQRVEYVHGFGQRRSMPATHRAETVVRCGSKQQGQYTLRQVVGLCEAATGRAAKTKQTAHRLHGTKHSMLANVLAQKHIHASSSESFLVACLTFACAECQRAGAVHEAHQCANEGAPPRIHHKKAC